MVSTNPQRPSPPSLHTYTHTHTHTFEGFFNKDKPSHNDGTLKGDLWYLGDKNSNVYFFCKEIWSVQDLQWFSTNPTVRKMAEVHEEFTCCDCDVLFPSTSSVFYLFHVLGTKCPADIYLFKVNNRSSRKRCENTRTTSPVKSLNSLNCSGIFLYLKCTWRRSLFQSDS